MKRPLRIIAAALLMATALSVTNLTAKTVTVPKMYMFGFAASFNDSIVHLTEIVEVEKAYIESKNNFLLERHNYSAQLRNYLANQQDMPGRTCVVVSDTKRSKLEKKYMKLKRLYTDKRNSKPIDLRVISAADFRFNRVEIFTEPATQTEE